MRAFAVLVALAVLSGCTPPVPPTSGVTPATSDRPTALGQRAAHTATPLLDGSVLVAGGCDVDGCSTATASAYLLTSGGARPMSPLNQPRDGHTATRLADGRVVVIGGWAAEGQSALAGVEVFDPADGTWRPTGSLYMPRGGHAAAALGDGRVLVVGGRVGRGSVTARTEIFDPITATFGHGPDLPAPPVGRLRQARFKHAIVPWVDGTLLVVGGTSDDRELLDSTEVFDPQTSAFTPGPRLAHGRYKLSGGVAELADGRVVVGGGGPGAEVIEPGVEVSAAVAAVGSGVASFSTVSVVGSDLWFVGGYDRRVDLTGQDRRVPIAAL